jgi:hypothetical protein
MRKKASIKKEMEEIHGASALSLHNQGGPAKG